MCSSQSKWTQKESQSKRYPTTKESPSTELSTCLLGATTGTRTPDPRITNALLYQLSHSGSFCVQAGAKVQQKVKSEK